MRKCAALLTMFALTGCGEPEKPVIVSVDTLCTSTTRYHATEAQVAAFKADRPLWETLVDWLASFNKYRDGRRLQSSPY